MKFDITQDSTVGKIEEAKRLVDMSFHGEIKNDWTEGSVNAGLRICEKNGGLFVVDDSCFSFFRYWPGQREIVESMDWFELEQANLSTGPIMHVIAFIAPRDGYRLFRALIAAINPYGVTAFRFTKGEWRFTARRNMRFVDVGWRRDGQFRRQQQQEQEQSSKHV